MKLRLALIPVLYVVFAASLQPQGGSTQLPGCASNGAGGINCAGGLAAGAINGTVNASLQSGADASGKLNACFAALPGGGVCDARGFGATTQTIASTVTVGTSVPQTLECDPSTVYVPGTVSVVMFVLNKGSHLHNCHIDVTGVSGFSGTVVSMTDNYRDGDNTALDGLHINGPGNTTGNGLVMTSASSLQAVDFVHASHIRCYGMRRCIYLAASGAGWINGNIFEDVMASGTVVGVEMNATSGGDVEGNSFTDYSYQYSAATTENGILASGSGARSQVKSNHFFNAKIWDVSGAANAADFSNEIARDNLVFGESQGTFRYGSGGNALYVTNHNALIENVSGPHYYYNQSPLTNYLSMGAQYGPNNASAGYDMIYDLLATDASAYDQFRFGLHYAGASSTSNYGWIGFTGAPALFQFTPSGGFTAAGPLAGSNVTTGGWSQTTPTVTCGSGTPTAITATVRVAYVGKQANLNISVVDTANGTCAGTIYVPLPLGTHQTSVLACTEYSQTGTMGTAVIKTTNVANIQSYSNATLAATGNRIACNGTVETH
jgi:hypothetical protein